MRIAIVHYWFLLSGGGERVVEVLADMFPEADFFALFADPESLPPSIRGRKLTTSFLDKLPLARRINRAIFPLYPIAVESFDLRGYDLVISSDSPPVKGLILDQSARHICYCHTPGRYIWDAFSEFRSGLPRLLRPLYTAAAHYVRNWDFESAQRIDKFIANSRFVSQRIAQYYRRESTVIYPPVETGMGYISATHDKYYLSVGRLVASKRLELLIGACNLLYRPLLIVGAGREEKRLKAISGPTIQFLGRVPDDQLPGLYANARAFLFAAEEDFGIVPIEAQAFGRPVICYGRGGSLETVLGYGLSEQPTGFFFGEQSASAVINAIMQFEQIEDRFEPQAIQRHARKFDRSVFESQMRQVVDEVFRTVPTSVQSSTQSDAAFTSDLASLGRNLTAFGPGQPVTPAETPVETPTVAGSEQLSSKP